MADIQPKNTDTIRVNKVKEKTSGTKITLDNITLVDEIKEKTASNGVRLNDILKCTTAFIPMTATINFGTSTAAEHILEGFFKELTSNGQALSVGTDSAHSMNLKSLALTRFALESDGDLAQDATNGGNIIMTKASTALAQPVAVALTAAGTVITDALDLTAVFNQITTAAAGSGVQLWDAPVGAEINIVNSGANALLVYPHSGAGTLNSGVAGASVSVATNTYNVFVRVSSTNWIAREITSAAA